MGLAAAMCDALLALLCFVWPAGSWAVPVWARMLCSGSVFQGFVGARGVLGPFLNLVSVQHLSFNACLYMPCASCFSCTLSWPFPFCILHRLVLLYIVLYSYLLIVSPVFPPLSLASLAGLEWICVVCLHYAHVADSLYDLLYASESHQCCLAPLYDPCVFGYMYLGAHWASVPAAILDVSPAINIQPAAHIRTSFTLALDISHLFSCQQADGLPYEAYASFLLLFNCACGWLRACCVTDQAKR
jgi:hypothetical protein